MSPKWRCSSKAGCTLIVMSVLMLVADARNGPGKATTEAISQEFAINSAEVKLTQDGLLSTPLVKAGQSSLNDNRDEATNGSTLPDSPGERPSPTSSMVYALGRLLSGVGAAFESIRDFASRLLTVISSFVAGIVTDPKSLLAATSDVLAGTSKESLRVLSHVLAHAREQFSIANVASYAGFAMILGACIAGCVQAFRAFGTIALVPASACTHVIFVILAWSDLAKGSDILAGFCYTVAMSFIPVFVYTLMLVIDGRPRLPSNLLRGLSAALTDPSERQVGANLVSVLIEAVYYSASPTLRSMCASFPILALLAWAQMAHLAASLPMKIASTSPNEVATGSEGSNLLKATKSQALLSIVSALAVGALPFSLRLSLANSSFTLLTSTTLATLSSFSFYGFFAFAGVMALATLRFVDAYKHNDGCYLTAGALGSLAVASLVSAFVTFDAHILLAVASTASILTLVPTLACISGSAVGSGKMAVLTAVVAGLLALIRTAQLPFVASALASGTTPFSSFAVAVKAIADAPTFTAADASSVDNLVLYIRIIGPCLYGILAVIPVFITAVEDVRASSELRVHVFRTLTDCLGVLAFLPAMIILPGNKSALHGAALLAFCVCLPRMIVRGIGIIADVMPRSAGLQAAKDTLYIVATVCGCYFGTAGLGFFAPDKTFALAITMASFIFVDTYQTIHRLVNKPLDGAALPSEACDVLLPALGASAASAAVCAVCLMAPAAFIALFVISEALITRVLAPSNAKCMDIHGLMTLIPKTTAQRLAALLHSLFIMAVTTRPPAAFASALTSPFVSSWALHQGCLVAWITLTAACLPDVAGVASQATATKKQLLFDAYAAASLALLGANISDPMSPAFTIVSRYAVLSISVYVAVQSLAIKDAEGPELASSVAVPLRGLLAAVAGPVIVLPAVLHQFTDPSAVAGGKARDSDLLGYLSILLIVAFGSVWTAAMKTKATATSGLHLGTTFLVLGLIARAAHAAATSFLSTSGVEATMYVHSASLVAYATYCLSTLSALARLGIHGGPRATQMASMGTLVFFLDKHQPFASLLDALLSAVAGPGASNSRSTVVYALAVVGMCLKAALEVTTAKVYDRPTDNAAEKLIEALWCFGYFVALPMGIASVMQASYTLVAAVWTSSVLIAAVAFAQNSHLASDLSTGVKIRESRSSLLLTVLPVALLPVQTPWLRSFAVVLSVIACIAATLACKDTVRMRVVLASLLACLVLCVLPTRVFATFVDGLSAHMPRFAQAFADSMQPVAPSMAAARIHAWGAAICAYVVCSAGLQHALPDNFAALLRIARSAVPAAAFFDPLVQTLTQSTSLITCATPVLLVMVANGYFTGQRLAITDSDSLAFALRLVVQVLLPVFAAGCSGVNMTVMCLMAWVLTIAPAVRAVYASDLSSQRARAGIIAASVASIFTADARAGESYVHLLGLMASIFLVVALVIRLRELTSKSSQDFILVMTVSAFVAVAPLIMASVSAAASFSAALEPMRALYTSHATEVMHRRAAWLMAVIAAVLYGSSVSVALSGLMLSLLALLDPVFSSNPTAITTAVIINAAAGFFALKNSKAAHLVQGVAILLYGAYNANVTAVFAGVVPFLAALTTVVQSQMTAAGVLAMLGTGIALMFGDTLYTALQHGLELSSAKLQEFGVVNGRHLEAARATFLGGPEAGLLMLSLFLVLVPAVLFFGGESATNQGQADIHSKVAEAASAVPAKASDKASTTAQHPQPMTATATPKPEGMTKSRASKQAT